MGTFQSADYYSESGAQLAQLPVRTSVVSGVPGTPVTEGGISIHPMWDTSKLVLKLCGDSRFGGGQGLEDTGNAVIGLAVGDTTNNINGPQWWAEYFSGGAISVINYSVIGTRVQAILDSQLPQALASGNPANEVIAVFTTANDRSVVPVTPTADILNALNKVYQQVLASGRRLLIMHEPPARTSYWTGSAPDAWAQIVMLQKRFAAANPGLVKIADCITPVISGTGAARAQNTTQDPYYDMVHPAATTAALWGKAMITALDTWLNPFTRQFNLAADQTAPNAIVNAALTGTGGTTFAGNAPTSWTINRGAANSWDGTTAWSADIVPRANSVAYAVGTRLSVPGAAFDYIVTVAGTTGASAPTFNNTLLAATTDGTATLLTIPQFRALDGVAGTMIYGANTANNTTGFMQQDIDMASNGFAVGDTVVGSWWHAGLNMWASMQAELRAMTGTTKIVSNFGLSAKYANVPAALPEIYGLIKTPPMVIPPGANKLRLLFTAFSRSTFNSFHILSTPRVYKIS